MITFEDELSTLSAPRSQEIASWPAPPKPTDLPCLKPDALLGHALYSFPLLID